MASNDLRSILAGWEYDPEAITVRRIHGEDGRVKIQMRLDLGVLQMETSGRPDGMRPFGAESLLHHQQARLADYINRNGTDLGFSLSPSECRALREESVMFYHRYLSLFVLEDYEGVVRDTARNLAVLDLCKRFAAEPGDREVLEQYRPYIIMMNSRGQAHKSLRRRKYKTALAAVDNGLRTVREHFEQLSQPELFEESSEVEILQRLRAEIVESMPRTPVRRLEHDLAAAVREERYEDAAALRDRIAAMKSRARARPRKKPER